MTQNLYLSLRNLYLALWEFLSSPLCFCHFFLWLKWKILASHFTFCTDTEPQATLQYWTWVQSSQITESFHLNNSLVSLYFNFLCEPRVLKLGLTHSRESWSWARPLSLFCLSLFSLIPSLLTVLSYVPLSRINEI